MPKPKGITRQHILDAMEYINQNGVPPKNNAPVYQVKHHGKSYPVLYLIRVAQSYSLYNKVVEPLPADNYNSNDACDILRGNDFYPRATGEVKLWKINHGKKTVKPQALRMRLKERGVITMGADTAKNQGERFMNDMTKGDIFYLCYTESIQLIGVITSEKTSPNPEMGTGWVEHSYQILWDATSNKPYPGNGFKKSWTPNYTSTLSEIKQADFSDFEKYILKPYFNKKESDLLELITGNNLFSEDTEITLKDLAVPKIDKNTLLYGPPGTGKTHHTAIYAVAICDPSQSLEELKEKAKTKDGYDKIYARYLELIKKERVKFITFHQSYGYEDFMEGIKPKIDESTGKKDVYYDVEDGVFKMFCKKNDWFEIAWNQLVDDANANNGIITVTWDAKKNPPEMRKLKYWKNTEDTGYAFYDAFNEPTKYHKATKDQVQGILEGTVKKPQNGNSASYNISCAVLKKLKSGYGNKVFIIDEINRGNISKIFGELITLIEDDKRERETLTLPYSGESFTIPKNIYILGTMNTADRSIALMDTALRRRFTFEEMMPEPELFKKDVDGISICNLLTVLNERIKYLYDREHTIGHAYFKECLHEKGDVDTLWNIFKNKIIPLLQEYFYDDYEKIALVLGDAGVSDKMRFVSQKKVPDFLANTAYDEGAKYEINPKIWDLTKDDRVARLKAIYEKSALQSNETEEEI